MCTASGISSRVMPARPRPCSTHGSPALLQPPQRESADSAASPTHSLSALLALCLGMAGSGPAAPVLCQRARISPAWASPWDSATVGYLSSSKGGVSLSQCVPGDLTWGAACPTSTISGHMAELRFHVPIGHLAYQSRGEVLLLLCTPQTPPRAALPCHNPGIACPDPLAASRVD